MFGSHLSISGGMHNALLEAERLTFNTVQVFTKNQQQWQAKPLDPAAVTEFRRHADRLAFAHIVAHDSYLINLASGDDALREKSIEAFAEEMRRCDMLGISYLVTHPGAHVGQGEEVGLARVADALRRVFKDQAKGQVTVCIESTAGQGSSLGYRFEHLKYLLDALPGHARLAVCVDTCHISAAGYDLSTAESTQTVLQEFDRVVGLKHLKVWHLNDSKKPCGSRVDRHEHLGRGCIGPAAFGVIAADPRFAKIPKILETPKDKAPDGRDWDEINLQLLRDLQAGKRVKIDAFPAATDKTPNTKDPKKNAKSAKKKA